ncbi:glycosyltransferase [Bacillus sp. B15-48]|uniref:MGDG synthase family glycosyltransferase n=1 Tax=Bacillus sp. B15-48 TaxID=1548601 RepID=UPI00193F17F8|nr:glycosyltransferase [Bacillus sp. B15-48]MBM4762835.1 UDP-glucuronosyltransferase [Bacillus sp. B15-48]
MKTKSVLFLPFLQIPSGHHQAANAILNGLKQNQPNVKCEVVDILAYSYGKIETLVSKIYLGWIQLLPGLYNFIYQHSVYKNIDSTKRYRLYEVLFLYFMRRLINEKQPDLIICTHALPSYMLNHLKQCGTLNIPVVNVYTDYFINQIWGVDMIDFHFVPSVRMQRFLQEKGVQEDRIYYTGIPIHDKIKKFNEPIDPSKTSNPSVLVSGGSLGVGAIEQLLKQITESVVSDRIQFIVLCGKNKRLYEKIKGLKLANVIPYSYINCMEQMNTLYDQVDAIITKPGGVTITESLFKRKPIFIYQALPGQEKINLEQLKELGVVYPLMSENICEEILAILCNEKELENYQSCLERFHTEIHSKKPAEIIGEWLL